MSHQEIIDVVSAHREGKQIQTRSHFHPIEDWQNCNPNWDFYQYDYRVAPEPRKPREIRIVPLGGGYWHEYNNLGVVFREVID